MKKRKGKIKKIIRLKKLNLKNKNKKVMKKKGKKIKKK